jgi:hypothetical protein
MDSIALNKLYILKKASGTPSIHVQGGTVDIYGSFKLPISSPITDDMSLSQVAFTGIDDLGVLPPYIFVSQNSGTTDYIRLDGVNAREVV